MKQPAKLLRLADGFSVFCLWGSSSCFFSLSRGCTPSKAPVLYHSVIMNSSCHEKKGTCFCYIGSDKSWPQHIQTAVCKCKWTKVGGGQKFPSQRNVYLADKVGRDAVNMILDTSLLQISHLGVDTVNRWHAVLESGRWGRSCCSLV